MTRSSVYRGRFAPSPTGPLHAGSMVAALASWLDARAHRGCWIVRMEDVDTPRCLPGVDGVILAQLAACHLLPDEIAPAQTTRAAAYADALQQLTSLGATFRCSCSRRQIAAHWERLGLSRARHDEWPYPGTCRERHDVQIDTSHSVRLRCGTDRSPIVIEWHDRRLGAQCHDLTRSCGDFIVLRSDGLWAYQLAVVVDDAAQGITDVVRGEDLVDNTPRQLYLQRLLGLPHPRHLHAPLVLGTDGQKLSKQNGARAIDTTAPMNILRSAGAVLGLDCNASTPDAWLAEATQQWASRYLLPTAPT